MRSFTPRQELAIDRRWRNTTAAAAVALEQAAEAADQKLALAEHITPLLDGAVHRHEGLDQVAVGEDVVREVRHALDAESGRELVQGGLREIHRPVLPALAPAHPSACGSAGLKTNSVDGVASSTWPRLLTTDPPFSVTATTSASWICGGYSWVVKSARIRLRPVRCRSHQYSVEFLGSLRATPEDTRLG